MTQVKDADDPFERTMKELRREAEDHAREIINRKLRLPNAMEQIELLNEEYTRKLEITKIQLTSSVQAKLDGVKRATDFIDDGTTKLRELRRGFSSMQQICDECSGLLGTLPRLKRVSIAQSNLGRTIRQVHIFSHIPQRVRRLQAMLEEDPQTMLQVYRESQQLEILREELLREVKVISERARESEASGGASPAAEARRAQARILKGETSAHATEDASYSSEDCERILHVLGGHFGHVVKLSEQVRRHIWDNIANYWELMNERPRQLQATGEVIALHEDYQRRKREKGRERAKTDGVSEEEAIEMMMIEDIRGEVTTRLRQAVQSRVMLAFAQIHVATPDGGIEGQVQATLGAANRLLMDLTIAKHDVVPHFPAEYGVLQLFRECYEAFLVQKVQLLYSEPEQFAKLSPGDALQIIEWIEFYNATMDSLGVSGSCEEFIDATAALMRKFLDKLRELVMQWFVNIRSRELDYYNDTNDLPISAQPEDTLNIINIQVRVAKRSLSGAYLSQVIRECLMILDEVREQDLHSLAATYTSLEPVAICVKANDFERMPDLLENFFEDVSDSLSDGDRGAMEDLIDETARTYVVSAKMTVDLLVCQIFEELVAANAYEDQFTDVWIDGEDEAASTVVATLEDYFDNVIRLSSFSSNTFLLRTMQRSVADYVENLLADRREAVSDRMRAARELRADHDVFLDFFGRYEDELRMAGLRGERPVEQQLQVVLAIADLFESMTPVEKGRTGDVRLGRDAKGAVERVLAEFSSQGVGVVMRILQLRGDVDRAARDALSADVAGASERFARTKQDRFSLPHIADALDKESGVQATPRRGSLIRAGKELMGKGHGHHKTLTKFFQR